MLPCSILHAKVTLGGIGLFATINFYRDIRRFTESRIKHNSNNWLA